MAELEPCPFCGREAVITQRLEKGRTRDIMNAFARCTFCGARSRNVSSLHVAKRNLERYAAKDWNARLERTCEVVSVRHDPVYGSVYTLSCCDDEVIHDGEGDPPKHCQHCGAKVVGE